MALNDSDDKKWEDLNNRRSKQWIKLYKTMMDARDKSDAPALAKAKEAMRKHEEKDAVLVEKARREGFDWC